MKAGIIYLTTVVLILFDLIVISENLRRVIPTNCNYQYRYRVVSDDCMRIPRSNQNPSGKKLGFLSRTPKKTSGQVQDRPGPRGPPSENYRYDKPQPTYGIPHPVGLPNNFPLNDPNRRSSNPPRNIPDPRGPTK